MNFKVVIAVNTGDFFNDVSLDCNILCCPPAWNRYAEVIVVELNLKAEAFKCCNNSVVADFNACVAVNKVLSKSRTTVSYLNAYSSVSEETTLMSLSYF